MAQKDIISIDWTPVIKAQEQCPRKIVQKTAKAILKKTDLADKPPKRKFSLKALNDTKDLCILAAYLFVFEQYDLCYQVCSIYNNVDFNGDYTLWHEIKKLRHLQIVIMSMNGENEKKQDIYNSLENQRLPIENQVNVWAMTYQNALDLERHYQEAKDGLRTPSVVRRSMLSTAMVCMEFVIMGYLPEKHEMMKEWIKKIFEFLRAEEK